MLRSREDEAVSTNFQQSNPHVSGLELGLAQDPHCKTTVSFCFSGQRKWRMMDAWRNPSAAEGFMREGGGREEESMHVNSQVSLADWPVQKFPKIPQLQKGYPVAVILHSQQLPLLCG